MAILVDTNVLLRAVQPAHPMRSAAVRALGLLLGRDERLIIAIQNVAEFWNAATRPQTNNGMGWTIEETRTELVRMEKLFSVVPETLASFARWKALVTEGRIQGAQVHDARLASIMMTYGIRQILTFDVVDFARYVGIEALHPNTIS